MDFKKAEPITDETKTQSSSPDLYEYLRKECPDLESAKRWIRKWCDDWDQVLPWDDEAEFTVRAMAGHLSHVLEGGDYDNGYAVGGFSYMATKHGTELFWAAHGTK